MFGAAFDADGSGEVEDAPIGDATDDAATLEHNGTGGCGDAGVTLDGEGWRGLKVITL